MNDETIHQHVGRAIDEGWLIGGSFLSSVLAGALIGYLADMWLGTDPWLVAAGILLGSYSGFMNLWKWSKSTEEAERES
ncbi:MAG TPA: AtpZ/AtpI family protein [Acidimicrobiia bacterium]|nr:AtpZ/AtpI family protein [Acidimicrobiia bacterium]